MTPGLAREMLLEGLTSLAVGVALLACAAVIVAPTLEPLFMGARYAELASVPLGELRTYPLEGARMLTPAIGRLLHFTGSAWIWFPLTIGGVFLAGIHRFLRTLGFSPWEAVAASALVAFGVPISWTLAVPGYVDTTTWLLLLGAFVQVYRRSHTWVFFFGLMPLNHEAGVFLAPALLALAVYRAAPEQRVRTGVVWVALCAVALLPALLVRAQLAADLGAAPGRAHVAEMGKYLISGLPTLSLGVFMGWKSGWFLPVFLGVVEKRAGGLRMTWVVLVVVACTLAQLLFAMDTTRLMAPAFLAMLLCLIELRKRLAPRGFAVLLGGVLAVNILTPQIFAVPQGLLVCQPLPVALVLANQGRHDFRRLNFFQLDGPPPMQEPPRQEARPTYHPYPRAR